MRVTAKDVYEALVQELAHPNGYISRDPLTDSITVDGVISCEDIAKFLNERIETRRE